MPFKSYVPTGGQPIPAESSPLRTRRDPFSPGYLWRMVRSGNRGVDTNRRAIQKLSKKLTQMGAPPHATGKMHPFKIYQLPQDFSYIRTNGISNNGNVENITADNEWRSVRVRAGLVTLESIPGFWVSNGTDGVDIEWEDVYVSNLGGVTPDSQTDYICENNAVTYFWIQVNSNNAVLKRNVDPSVDGWSDWPNTTNANIIPVGWVDTVSWNHFRRPYIRQILPHDVLENAGAAGETNVSQYRYKSMANNHILACPWDGSTEGSNVNVAKPYKLRFSIASATMLDGNVVNYSGYNTTNQYRLAAIGNSNIKEVIVPPYLVNDIIYVLEPDHTSVDNVELLDINADGRAWASKWDQT